VESKKPALRAIVFDMDGLMVDSEPLARQAWDQVLREYGHRLGDDVHRRIVGRRSADSAQIVHDAYALPLSVQELVTAKTAEWEKIWRRGLPPMPGLSAIHARLVAGAIPWAVATSSPRGYAEAVLRKLGMDDWHALAGGDEVVQGKPAPDIYLLAARRLNIAPELCLALEDSVPGGQAALAAGMTIGVIPSGTPPAAFDFADYLFDSLVEVADRLDELLR
jgi:HAD superfamily hydrolase (TIGR01509 family)